jgi:hypothetical protein
LMVHKGFLFSGEYFIWYVPWKQEKLQPTVYKFQRFVSIQTSSKTSQFSP